MAIVRKELDWVIHDKVSMLILFVLPALLLGIVGLLANTNIETDISYHVYIIDNDQSEYSQAFIDFYKGRDWSFLIVEDSNSNPNITLEVAEELIYTTQLDAYIILPSNFSETLINNRSANIQMTINGIDPIAAVVIRIAFNYGNVQYQLNNQVFNGEILFFPENHPKIKMRMLATAAPIIIPMVLFACVNMVASQCIIADEPLKRLLLTPTNETDVIIAKTIAYSYLSSIVSFSVVFILAVAFKITFISFIDTAIITFMIALFGVTFGILFSSLATSRLQAAQWFLFAYIIQVILVMNLRITGIVEFMPIEIVRASFVDSAYRGIPLILQWENMIKIIGMNAGALIGANLIYRKKKRDV
jgi:hypothetical protein